MKKIPSLFKRNYDGDRLVRNEVVEGSEWVLNGEGWATVKYDGTCCKIDLHGRLWKRFDRKLTKAARSRKRRDDDFVPSIEDFKPAPDSWQAAESQPNIHTGHWPGWVLVSADLPQDKWHLEALADSPDKLIRTPGTWELVGPKIQGNPYGLDKHELWIHGETRPFRNNEPPRDFEGLKTFLGTAGIEGIVWHHPDGRMIKIKSKDFGIDWKATLVPA